MPNNENIIEGENLTEENRPGHLLAEKRKKAKLSEVQVADALKISVSRLKSIENNDFSVFHSETYVRGHLRNYSRYLKCDEMQILGAYDNAKLDGMSPILLAAGDAILPSKSKGKNNSKRGAIVCIVVLFLAAVWALSYWVLDVQGNIFSPSVLDAPSEPVISSHLDFSRDHQELSQGATPRPLVDEVRPLENLNDELEFISDGFSSSNSLPVDTIETSQVVSQVIGVEYSENTDSVDQTVVVNQLTASELVKSIKEKEKEKEKVDDIPVVPVIEGDLLEFAFVSPSWVQVTDVTRAVLFKGTSKSGAELVLNGKAPFKVVIGNVAGTSLVYNGESVSLDAPTGKNTLRITLGD